MQPIPSKFRQYPSIQLSTRANFINRLKQNQFTSPQIQWVASQKIHGSNFSTFCNGTYVKYGRRNDFITKDIPVGEQKLDPYFLEAFYSAPTLVIKFHNKLGDLFSSLKETYPNIASYTLYGEYFGGNWVEKTASKAKAVQTGIKYTPNHEFLVFDVNIKTTDDQDFWVDALDIEKLVGKFIGTVPIYAKGTFDEVYAVNTKIDSTIPELLGLKKVQDNLIEGMVLRPNKTVFLEDDRVMLKKKNAEFQEKAPVEAKKGGKKQQKEKEISADILQPYTTLSTYLNDNRIESILSKFPALKDRNKLKTQIYQDILKDAIKDQYKAPQGDTLKKLTTQFDKKIMKALNEYFSRN